MNCVFFYKFNVINNSAYEKIFAFFLVILLSSSFAQDLNKMAKDITDEAVELYRSEMASWYGTDVYQEKNLAMEKIGGYFSYFDQNITTNIFFNEKNKVIATISFPTNYNTKDAKIDIKERDFTETEKIYYELRKKAIERIKNDTIFKFYT